MTVSSATRLCWLSKAKSQLVLIGSTVLQDAAEQTRRRQFAAEHSYLGLYFDPEIDRCSADKGCRHELQGSQLLSLGMPIEWAECFSGVIGRIIPFFLAQFL